jgi:hypothetical protein
MDAHNGGIEAHNGGIEAHNRGMEAHNGSMEAHNGGMEVTMMPLGDSHLFDEEQDPDPSLSEKLYPDPH